MPETIEELQHSLDLADEHTAMLMKRIQELEAQMEQEQQYIYRCSRCGTEIKHDHDGNGCHACGLGIMRRVTKRD